MNMTIRTQTTIESIYLDGDGLHLLDQRRLPSEEKWLCLTDLESIANAIETLAVRGAPAIGGAAALGMAWIAQAADVRDADAFMTHLNAADKRLRKTRPTAVNLFYALDRVSHELGEFRDVPTIRNEVFRRAKKICEEDAEACRMMGKHGSACIESGDRVLTICHTGALATCGQGTALGVLRTAKEMGKTFKVFALETRPLLQGARLTMWEGQKLGLDITLLTDGMAGFAFQKLGISKVVVGADRIARNGDVANKIGTYTLASLCALHDVNFYVAAPTSTFDGDVESGTGIEIEERAAEEVRTALGTSIAPVDAQVWNPAFDITPAQYVHGYISENGISAKPQ